MALSQGLIDTYWRRYNQRRALTGMPTSYQEQRGMTDSLLDAGLKDEELKYQRSIQNRQLSMQEQAQKDAQRAATISGVTNLASLGATSYLGYKALGKPTLADYLMSQQATTSPVTNEAITAASGKFGASTAEGAGYGLQTQGYTTPALQGAGSGGEGILAGAGSGAAATTGGSAAYTGATGTAAYGAAEGSGAAGVLGAEGASTTAGGSAMGGVGVAGPAALAAMAGIYGPGLLKKATGMNDTWSKGLVRGPESFLGAAAEHVGGKAAGWAVDPVGHIGDAISKTVICTELNRQGDIGDKELRLARIYRKNYVSDNMFRGYLLWATPVVKKMRSSDRFNRFFKPIARILVGQWCDIAMGKTGSVIGSAVHSVAYIASYVAYNMYYIKRGVVMSINNDIR